jgi:hypothetical protein
VTYTTNIDGLFSLRQLPIGQYVVEAEKTGFRRFVRSGLVLTTGQSLELDIALEVGAVSESITVSGSATLLETRTSDVAQLVEAKAVEDTSARRPPFPKSHPNDRRRSLHRLRQWPEAKLFSRRLPTAIPDVLDRWRYRPEHAIRRRPGRSRPAGRNDRRSKNYGQWLLREYGGSNGGVIVATTKSGTNNVHGSLFEYVRNDKFDAPNFFAPIVDGKKSRAPLRYNVYGGTIGGPVVIPKFYQGKDKTFFFFAYEGSRRRDGAIRTLTVPSALQRTGDFSQSVGNNNVLIPVYDPASTQLINGRQTRTQFPGNRIPASRLDPVASRLIPFYPLPNRAPDSLAGANNFRANFVNGLTRDNYTAKVDHNFGTRDRG